MLLRLQNAYKSMAQMAQAQERTAQNLANANTAGFKRQRIFQEAFNARFDAEQAPRSDHRHVEFSDMAQGVLEQTGNPLDVALEGNGFFTLTDPDTGDPRYTRDGHFMLSADGTLVNKQGLEVEGDGGPIVIPPEAGEISIAQNGEISANGQVVGRLSIVEFEEPAKLIRLDGAAFAARDEEPLQAENTAVHQGFVEGSNINPVHEMTEMIETFRMFESQQRSIRTTDQLLSTMVRDLGRW